MDAMTNKLKKLIELRSKGLVCLVPRQGMVADIDYWPITSHEKTLCDCQVLEILSALKICVDVIELQNEALSEAAKIHYSEKFNNHGCMATAKITDIAEETIKQAKDKLIESIE